MAAYQLARGGDIERRHRAQHRRHLMRRQRRAAGGDDFRFDRLERRVRRRRFDDDIRDLVTSAASVEEIKNYARSQGMTTLREAGLKLIFDGVTTIDEVVRETVMEDIE